MTYKKVRINSFQTNLPWCKFIIIIISPSTSVTRGIVGGCAIIGCWPCRKSSTFSPGTFISAVISVGRSLIPPRFSAEKRVFTFSNASMISLNQTQI